MKRKHSTTLLNDDVERIKKHLVSQLNIKLLSHLKSSQANTCGESLDVTCQDYFAYLDRIKQIFDTTGKLMAFGNGDCGQLGHGIGDVDNSDIYDQVNVSRPKIIESLKSLNFAAIAAGGLHNLALTSDALTIYSWGCNDNEVLGRDGDENTPLPVQMTFKHVITQLSAGDMHSCALDIMGRVFIWGTFVDQDGKTWFLKDNVKPDEVTEEIAEEAFGYYQREPKLMNLSKVTMLASGANHTLALDTNNVVYSWGIGDVGQSGRKVCALKDDEFVYQKTQIVREHLIPSKMKYASGLNAFADNIKYVSAGAYHSFVISTDNKVFACGLNQYSQLGIPNSRNTVENLVHVSSLGEDIKLVKGGEHFSLALDHSGHVFSFGRCDQAQLGIDLRRLGKEKSKPGAFIETPQRVEGENKELLSKFVVDVQCGTSHSLLITSTGECYAFGFGEMNQLGLGTDKDQDTPKLITKFDKQSSSFEGGKIVAASCGGQHSIVLIDK